LVFPIINIAVTITLLPFYFAMTFLWQFYL